MPVYEYECQVHGVFETFKPLAEYTAPASCPTCETPSARIMSVPRVSGMAKSTRIALERNERSRHEPRIAHGCGDHKHPAIAPGERPALKRYTGARPWVIEHG